MSSHHPRRNRLGLALTSLLALSPALGLFRSDAVLATGVHAALDALPYTPQLAVGWPPAKADGVAP